MMKISFPGSQKPIACSTDLAVSAQSKQSSSLSVSTMFFLPDNGLFGSDSHVFLPMMRQCPIVIFLNRFRSPGIWASRLFLYPMPLLRSVATIIVIISDRYFPLYDRMRIVASKSEVFKFKGKNVL